METTISTEVRTETGTQTVKIDNSTKNNKDFILLHTSRDNTKAETIVFNVGEESGLIGVNGVCLTKMHSDLLMEFLNQRLSK